MTFTLGHANIEQPDPLSKQLHTVNEVRDHCDLATWNEAMDTAGAIKAMGGWSTRTTGGLAISWKSPRFDQIDAGSERVMVGGNLGTGNPGDHRRRGPNRYVLWVVLREKSTDRQFIVATHHTIAKADTTAKWRRPLRLAAWRNVTKELAAVQKKHPGAPLILTGDWNTIGAVTAFVSLGVREVKTPATFGKRLRYDRIQATSGVSHVRTLTTESDHKALLATVTLGPAAEPQPEPTPEVPMPRLPADLPTKLRAHGLKVVEHGNWHDRGRPASTGGFAPVGVLCHHTATGKKTSDADVIALLIRGRSDLPGPLAHIGLDRDGVVHLIAGGRANHAGKAKSSGTVAAGDGNSLYVGIEAFNDGVGEKWPSVQYEAYAKLAAALCREVTGNSSRTVRGHKETSVTGKIDPTFDMTKFRSRVDTHLNSKPNPGVTLNNVQQLRADVLRAIREHGAKIPKNRPAARAWVAALTAVAKRGPKS